MNDNEVIIDPGFRRPIPTNCAQNRSSPRGTMFIMSSRIGAVLTRKAEMATVPMLASALAPLCCAAELASEMQIIPEGFLRKV